MSNAAQQIDIAPDGRQQARTHLFVAATLYSDGACTPVTIRNMSKSGALIEAPVLPEAGERIWMKRGPLQAIGWIAWRVERKAGIRFEAPVHIADWMSRQGSAGQECVDALISIVRSDAPGAAAELPHGRGRTCISAELRELRQELAALEKSLLNDVILVATHPEIQTIDICVQRIDRILKSISAEG